MNTEAVTLGKTQSWIDKHGFGILLLFCLAFVLLLAVLNPNGKSANSGLTDEWNVFTSSKGHFKVLFPSYPHEQQSGDYPSTTYTSEASSGTYYTVSADDTNTFTGSDLRSNLKLSMDFASSLIGGGKLLSSKFITFKGYPATEGTFKTLTTYLRFRTVLTGHRMYILAVTSGKNDFPHLDTFFNSFETF